MSKILLFIMVSLDGYFEGQNHDISWHNADQEHAKFSKEQLDQADTLVFGHKTYKVMADFWTTPEAFAHDPDTASRMNKLPKVVFSHQAFSPEWENTEVSGDLVQKIQELKAQDGNNIAVMGSSHLGKQMLEQGLLDEVQIMVNPVFIGSGSTLFEGLAKNLNFKSTQAFKNGNVLLTYQSS